MVIYWELYIFVGLLFFTSAFLHVPLFNVSGANAAGTDHPLRREYHGRSRTKAPPRSAALKPTCRMRWPSPSEKMKQVFGSFPRAARHRSGLFIRGRTDRDLPAFRVREKIDADPLHQRVENTRKGRSLWMHCVVGPTSRISTVYPRRRSGWFSSISKPFFPH